MVERDQDQEEKLLSSLIPRLFSSWSTRLFNLMSMWMHRKSSRISYLNILFKKTSVYYLYHYFLIAVSFLWELSLVLTDGRRDGDISTMMFENERIAYQDTCELCVKWWFRWKSYDELYDEIDDELDDVDHWGDWRLLKGT